MIVPLTVLLPVDAAAAGVAALVELDELAAVVGVAAPAALVGAAALVEPLVLVALLELLAGACEEQAATRLTIATPKSPFAELARRARRDHAFRGARLTVLREDESI